MSLLTLPNELLLIIAHYLPYTWDINSLIQTNHRFYNLFNTHLYRQNVLHDDSSALEWVTLHGCASIVQKSLDEGGDPHAYQENFPIRPLAQATAQGHEDVVRVLLEHGAAPDINDGWMTENGPVESLLGLAVRNGHEGVVRLLVEWGADPRSLLYRKTGLHVAAASGRLEIARYLVEEGLCDLDAVDDTGYTPLMDAAKAGSVDMVRFLLERGADPDIRVMFRRWKIQVTAIYFAAATGHVETMRCLIEHGAEPNPCMRPICAALEEDRYDAARLLLEHMNVDEIPGTKHKQGLLLCVAAACSLKSTVRRLLDSGCPPSARPAEETKALPQREHWTALAWSSNLGYEEIAALLLERGADPDPNEWLPSSARPLQAAIHKGKERLVKLLLEHGADPNRFIGYDPPLFAAIPHEGIFELLLEHGANPSTRDDSPRATPLIAKVIMSGKTRLARILLERGKLVYSPGANPTRDKSLVYLATVGGVEMLDLVFQYGVGIPSPNSQEARYAVDAAIARGDVAALKFLLDKEYTLIAPDDDIPSAIDRVVQLSDKSTAAAILDILLSHGVDLESRDPYQRTCLWQAIERGDSAGLKLLLDKGANPLSRDWDDETPLSWAAGFRYTECVEQLLQSIKKQDFPREEAHREMATAEDKAAGSGFWKNTKVLQRAQTVGLDNWVRA